MILRLCIPLCALLTAAHYLRFGTVWNALPALLPLATLIWRRPVFRPLLILCALAAAGVWTQLGVDLVRTRLLFGQPWLRLAGIMGGVTALHLLGAALLLGQSGRRLFGPLDARALCAAVTAVLTAGGLSLAVWKSPFAVLLGERLLPGSNAVWISLGAMYAALVAEHFLERPDPRLRGRIWTLFSAVFFGQLLLGLAGWSIFLMTGTLHLPVPALILAGPLYRGEGFFMPILLGVSLLVVGPAWCSHLCYIGAWDDRLARLGPRRLQPLPAWAPRLRLGLLLATPVVALGARGLGVPWAPALTLAALFGAAGIGLMLLWSRRTGVMTHCTVWCPVGLLNNLLGRLLPWRVTIDPSCSRCGACTAACRYNALTAADLQRGRPGLSCSLCGDCLPRCPHNHLGYHFPGLGPEGSRRLFIVLTVTLHSVFLAVARI